jgi:hypothetical protein
MLELTRSWPGRGEPGRGQRRAQGATIRKLAISAASGLRGPSDWLRSEAGDGRDRLLWARLAAEESPPTDSFPVYLYEGRKLLKDNIQWLLKKPPKPPLRRGPSWERGEWDKMVGLGRALWVGPARPELPAYTTLEDLFYWHPLDPDHKKREPRRIDIGGDKRDGGETVWHVPGWVLADPRAAKRVAKDTRGLRRLGGHGYNVFDNTVAHAPKPHYICVGIDGAHLHGHYSPRSGAPKAYATRLPSTLTSTRASFSPATPACLLCPTPAG